MQYSEHMSSIEQKITTREELAPKVVQWREEGKAVGFTSGTFDILHAGHVSYLEAAKKKCDILIVGVNSDESVRGYKGPNRPVQPEDARLRTVAALGSVDHVFLFHERRNRQNLETLKPSLYIKAGDYSEDELTSADVVRQYGGDVLLLPVEDGISTSHVFERIAQTHAGQNASASVKTEMREQQKAILLDRDGTINEDIEYLHEPEKFALLPNAAEGLKKLQAMGYKLVVVTLQAGIGLGYFSKEDFFKVNREMFAKLAPYGVTIDKIYFATHAKTDDGKNPKEALLTRAREELDLDLSKSVVIGDKSSDLAPGKMYDCLKIGVQTGKALADKQADVTPDYLAEDLLDAANWLEKQS